MRTIGTEAPQRLLLGILLATASVSLWISNYVAVDMSTTENGRYPMLDCFHETFMETGSSKRIAHSFSDFLDRALQSGGRPYWLKDGWTLGE
jgi:hypothetical protein